MSIQAPSLFSQATKAMFFLAVIMGLTVIATLAVSSAWGRFQRADVTMFNPRTTTQGMIIEGLSGHRLAAQLGPGLAGYLEDDRVIITEYGRGVLGLDIICGPWHSTGDSLVDPLVHQGVFYSLFGDEAIALNPSTGQSDRLSKVAWPAALSTLNDDQIYGQAALPAGISRVDAAWLTSQQAPSLTLRTTENCAGVVLGNLGAIILFGFLALLGLAYDYWWRIR